MIGPEALLDDAVQRCLAKEPSARWRDAIARCTVRRNTGASATLATSGTTSGRTCREWGATNVVAIASIPHMSTGPPFERL